eukprot:COSAG01_NODE_57865_length_309_cov_1.476190_1_plen_35_part_10
MRAAWKGKGKGGGGGGEYDSLPPALTAPRCSPPAP